jgi:hypothetical protein
MRVLQVAAMAAVLVFGVLPAFADVPEYRPPSPEVVFAEPVALDPEDVVQKVTVTKPVDPRNLKKLRKECGPGKATVRVLIDRKGKCKHVELIGATCEAIGKEFVRTAWKWKFKPATVNGKAVAAYFEFQLVVQ